MDAVYKKENNLFQSEEWKNFQAAYGREVKDVSGIKGIALEIPLGQKFLWIQKGPGKMDEALTGRFKELASEFSFVRVEPEVISEEIISRYSLKIVGKGSLLSGQASPKATRILKITGAEEELLKEMKSKTRYNIRLSEKNGVKIECTDNVDVLYDLLLSTAGRDRGYTPHEKKYYEVMMKTPGMRDKVKIFVAKKNGEYLAAIMVSFYGEVATYLHGGFSEKHRSLMAPYICQWEAIKCARNEGCKYYDFWGVSESDSPDDPWAGISRFKEGFGGEKVVYPGTYDLVLRPFWYNLLSAAAKLKHLGRR